MRRVFLIAVGLFLAGDAVLSQSVYPPFQPPANPRDAFPRLSPFLQLTNEQALALLRASYEFNRRVFDRSRRISQVQQELVDETNRSPLDPLALGQRYAELETICREIDQDSRTVREQQVQALTAAQRERLKVLEDAVALMSTVGEAQYARLMAGGYGPTTNVSFVNPNIPGTGLAGVVLGGFVSSPSVCGVGARLANRVPIFFNEKQEK